MILEAGDVVTADLRLAAGSNLQADESALTGESIPVNKSIEAVDANAAMGERTSMAFKGCAITQGAGEGIVVATGMQTELDRISNLAQSAASEVAPLERRLDRLGQRLVLLTLVLAALVIGAGILRGFEVAVMIQTGVALAVAAVAEGLPVVATLCLARGMWRMAERNALITQLSSVETLGATTIILTDKTGSLTENRMTVMRYLLVGDDVVVDDGAFTTHGEALTADGDERLAAALRVGALCNNAVLGEGSDDGRSGDPMEIALLSVARDGNHGRDGLPRNYPGTQEHAFDPELKMMATVHRDSNGFTYAVKGAPEAVIAACDRALSAGGPCDLHEADRVHRHRHGSARHAGSEGGSAYGAARQ